MSKVNGNDGNNNDLMKGLQAYYEALRAKASGKANKPAEVKTNIPIGKQNGIHEVLKYYSINQDETMSFGDGKNDIDMFEYTKISVAMGNAGDDVKEAADYITDDIDEDGIYNALKHFELI